MFALERDPNRVRIQKSRWIKNQNWIIKLGIGVTFMFQFNLIEVKTCHFIMDLKLVYFNIEWWNWILVIASKTPWFFGLINMAWKIRNEQNVLGRVSSFLSFIGLHNWSNSVILMDWLKSFWHWSWLLYYSPSQSVLRIFVVGPEKGSTDLGFENFERIVSPLYFGIAFGTQARLLDF